MYDVNQSIFAGVPEATLRQSLADAQSAYHLLMTGAQAAETSYVQGDCTIQISYNPTEAPKLFAYIQQLQAALGITKVTRKPITFR
ncbi:MAG TPA: gpW family head-tail joining protein [Methanosarcina sp.]|nr:gpW family head-tail joining protein [Methanosarcina sp.]